MPKPRDLAKFGERWRPFRTVASWYLWRATELGGKNARKISKRTIIVKKKITAKRKVTAKKRAPNNTIA